GAATISAITALSATIASWRGREGSRGERGSAKGVFSAARVASPRGWQSAATVSCPSGGSGSRICSPGLWSVAGPPIRLRDIRARGCGVCCDRAMSGPVLLRRERRLLAPPDAHRWWRSHAQCPTVLELHEALWRVYFAARDAN